jgi:hypothetical protein
MKSLIKGYEREKRLGYTDLVYYNAHPNVIVTLYIPISRLCTKQLAFSGSKFHEVIL